MWLEAPEIQGGAPGQFVMVRCEGHTLARPLGIAERNGNALRLVFAVKGDGTQWLAAREVNDEATVQGPLGNGFPLVDGRVLLIGGGLGLPPLHYAATAYDCDAAVGFRNKAAALLVPDLASKCKAVAVATDDGSLGLTGNALAAAEVLCNNSYAAVFACGPTPLLRATKAWAAERGLACYLSLEERMACGVGACLVCACASGDSFKRVCKDGPVFSAEEVGFDG